MRIIRVFLAAASLAAAKSDKPLTQTVLNRYQAMRQNLIETAEAMPRSTTGSG
jgi:hypothetical protein